MRRTFTFQPFPSEERLSARERRQNRWARGVGTGLAAGNLTVLAFFLAMGNWAWSFALLLITGAYLSPFVLIRAGHHTLGRLVPVLAAGLGIIGFCFVGGTASGAHLCLFMIACWPFALFDVRRYSTHIICALLIATSAFVFTELHVSSGTSWLRFEPSTLAMVRPILGALAFSFLGAVLYFVNRESQKHEDILTEQAVQLIQARDVVEKALSSRSQFLNLMSHELRTPMNGILGAVQGLHGTPLSQEQSTQLALLKQSGEYLHCLLRDIFDSVASQHKPLDLMPEACDLKLLFEQSVRPFETDAVQKGLIFQARLDVSPQRMNIDGGRFCQMISALVSNAVKFTDTGSISIEASTQQVGEEWALEFSVADTGRGIREELQQQLFEEFRQGDSFEHRNYEGVGLGLSSVKRIVHAMGGEVTVLSTVASGSKFTVRLRLTAAPASERPLANNPTGADSNPTAGGAASAESGVRWRGLRVLVAEDNLVNQQVICRLLSKLGITPTVVENGQLALDAVLESDWDLVLMDIQMPVMDGLEATRAIRALPGSRSKLPIVAVTANANPEQVEAGMNAGLSKYLTKPLRLVELKSVLEALAS